MPPPTIRILSSFTIFHSDHGEVWPLPFTTDLAASMPIGLGPAGTVTWTGVNTCGIVLQVTREETGVPGICATFRFSTAGLPEAARAEAVRDLHQRERTMLPAGLEPHEPLEPMFDRPPHADVIKRTLPGLALVSGNVFRPSARGTTQRGCRAWRERSPILR